MKQLKKVLFLPLLKMPSGHHQVAEALMDILERRTTNICYKKIDLLSYTNELLEKVVTGTYLKWIRYAPETYNMAYKHLFYEPPVHSFKWYHHVFAKKMEHLVKEENPDLIICTHGFPSYLLSQLKAKGKCNVPIINVYTDFFINNLWGKEEIDFHFLPSEEVKRGLRAQSEIPLQNMMVTGIPIHEEITRTRTVKHHGNGNILIAGGSSGLGNIMDFYNDLKDAHHFHYFVLCGKNQKLYEEIKGWELQHVTPIPYISSRTEMNELYERVDAIVTKPGGITVSEALCKKLPIFVHSALPGQEEVNLRYLTERNLVQELKADQSLENQLQTVLQDADKMSTLYNAIAAYHKEIEAQTPEELLAVVNWILGENQTMGLHA